MEDQMNKFKSLALEIETNRQRLHFAIASKNVSLSDRTLRLLVCLEAEFFNLAKSELPMKQDTKYLLVFSEEYSDGKRMSLIEYRAFTRRIAKENRMDLETHIAIEIETGMEEDVDKLLNGSDSQKKTA